MTRVPSLLLGWTCLTLGSPGILLSNGSLLLAILGVALVGAGMLQPLGDRPRRARAQEWLIGGLGACAALWWIYHVSALSLLPVALILGFYQCLAGLGMRLFARRLPVGLAVALGWWGAEFLRSLPTPPWEP